MSVEALRENYDPVTLEVIRMRLDNIVEEMGIAMIRSSGSPVITEARDYNTALFDSEGRFFSYSDAVQVHIGSGGVAVRNLITTVEPGEICAGDVFISNDPHTAGSSHPPDTTVITPIFRDEVLVGFAQSQAHLVDVGGMAPGGLAPGATDCFSEGLRLPPGVKIFDQGKPVESVRRLIANNVRVPELYWNDVRSMVASNTTGSKRLLEAIDEFGFETFRDYTALSFVLAEDVLRGRIGEIPNGTYEAEDWVEGNGHDDELYLVRCTMTIHDDSIGFDFDGSSPQTDGYINCSYGALVGSVASALVPILGWDVPFNEGVMTAFTITAPQGSIVNPTPPAPVSNGHMTTGIRATRLVVRLLNEACVRSANPTIRQRVQGEWADSFTGGITAGVRSNGEYFVWFNMDGSGTGTGAQLVRDGHDAAGAMTQIGNMLPDVEMNELLYPTLYLWKRLAPNTGGHGTSRGGMGLDFAWTLWGADSSTETLWSPVSAIPSGGFAGGLPGGGGGFEFHRNTNLADLIRSGTFPDETTLTAGSVDLQDSNSQMVPLSVGDVFRSWIAGGGGVGDPLLRDPELVAADVRDGYLTTVSAGSVYGVEIDATGGVDPSATTARRKEVRSQRLTSQGLPRPTATPLTVDDLTTASLVPHREVDGMWACPSCSGSLGAHSDWREGAVRTTYGAGSRLAESGTWVRHIDNDSRRIVLDEFLCQHCGTQLATQIRLDRVGATG